MMIIEAGLPLLIFTVCVTYNPFKHPPARQQIQHTVDI